MKSFLVLLFIGYWISLTLKFSYVFVFFGILYGIYLYSLYKRKSYILLWLFCCILSGMLTVQESNIPDKGEYTIYEIRNQYVLATDGSSKVVLYGIEHPNFGYTYHVSDFEKIHSLHNIGLYDFEKAMHKKGIDYSSNISADHLIKTSYSIKCKIYAYLSTMEESALYKKVFYGIHDDESASLFSRLSIPFIAFIRFLENLFNKKWDKEKSRYISLFIGIVLGYLFTFTVGYIRFLIYEIVSLCIKDWKMKYSLSYMIFLSLFPEYALEFIFLFPAGLQFLSHYTKGYYRTIASVVYSIFCQFIFFHEVDLFFLIFFSLIRSLYVYQFIFMLLGLYIPICLELAKLLCIEWNPLKIHYKPSIVFILMGIYLLYCLMKHKRVKEIIIICIFFLSSIHILPYCDPFFHVYMLDIGQGDCTLIVEPFLQSVVMIDCGGNLYKDNAKDILLPVLENLHIKEIDTLIISHDDYDHNGCKDSLLESIPIHQIVDTSDTKINVYYPFFSLLANREAKDENDRSIVSYFVYDDIKYLWMGDASIEIEKQLIQTYDLDVDIIKLGHHGSNTSSSYAFLDALRPKIGLVSVGLNNRYGHPSSQVISNCINLGIQPLQTSKLGMIHLFSYHGVLFFVTASGLFGIILP